MYTPPISQAPLPTPTTLRRRKSLPYQVYRFFVINLRMIRVIIKGH